MKTFLKNMLMAITFLSFVFGVNLMGCTPKTVHNAIVLENNEHTFIYGAVHKGDTVWANLETHEVDNEYADVMQCVITD